MDHDFYKQRIEELPIGYTYNKMICDQMGAPCDFELIEANEAFEKIIGLKKPHIIGKKITELFRGIADGESDWFHFYEEIALHRDKKEIKHYWKSKKRWYKIQAYSHEKLYVVAHFTDITLEMNQLSEMERLFEISDMLLQTNDQKIGYQQIAEDFLKISEAKYAAFNLFDEDGKSFKTMAITGDKGIVNKVSEMIGYRIDEKQWEYTEELDEKIKAKTITHFKGLRDMAGSAIPAAVAILLEKTLNIGEIVVIKISKQNVILGDFTLFMEKGKSFSKHMLAEVYTRQLGMLMSRKRAEERL
ncbi:MAG: PAS domain-containing protein, partial [Vallitaleaceae bacterium]|nr:PAS domain-containing protein [Vallitaleaceae bacterium]